MPKMDDDQKTLGELIDLLRMVREPDAMVFFEFAELYVTGIDSYRGYYEDLALSFASGRDYRPNGVVMNSVPELIALLERALDTTFVGWKGGNYPGHTGRAMWAANRGCTGGTAIVGVRDLGYKALIQTKHVD